MKPLQKILQKPQETLKKILKIPAENTQKNQKTIKNE
jgi:hypothetical protein